MELENKDVTQTSSPEQPSVNEVVTQPQENAELSATSNIPLTGEGNQPVADVDEMGVSWQNRAREYQRKLEDAEKRNQNQLEAILNEVKASREKSSEPKYSESELLAFANDPDISSNQKAWAYKQIEELRKTNLESVVQKQFEGFQRKQQEQMARQQATQYAVNQYPEIALKDNAGNVVGFDFNNPLMRQIDSVLRENPDLQKHPKGFAAAADMAFGRLTRLQQSKNMQNQEKLKQENLQLKKQTLTEGSGKPVVPEINPQRKKVEATISGNIKDAHEAMKGIMGINRE